MAYVPLADHKNDHRDYWRAKELRQAAASSERIFWHKLRLATKGMDFRFRRQHPIHPYIVDFVCLKLCLIVELDGASHDARLAYDKERDDYLNHLGFEVMHFTNEEVSENCDGIVQMVIKRAGQREGLMHPSPNPSRKGRGAVRAR